MANPLQHLLRTCLDDFRKGTLTEAKLAQAVASAEAPPRQSLLYLQLQNTHPESPALGYTLILHGRVVDPPRDPKDWPYRSALDAVRDGWRIISFPNLALLVDPVTSAGLGCEFILEKWS
jgi:hypothetical protein